MTGTITYTIDPFPGLRPFEPEHSALFFGREEQTDELLRRLERTRFLAVVGDSGSGKSSLVRAGLIPALQRGYLVEAGSRWEVALFRPGDDPVGNLARALCRSGKSGDTRRDAQQIQKILERNSMGLMQAAVAILPPKTNLLVVVDQFEEIFRYRQEMQKRDGGDSAAAFVKLLLNASQEEVSVVNVVLTMRSDFLGECSHFRGLPEALNGGQYLVPRLSREQMKEVIEGPAAVAGGEFAPMLVQRLLNDVGDNPDQLPVLQHALMRTWEESAGSREGGEPIALSHYEAIGGIAQALNRHVESAYRELSEDDREIAKKIFQRLTERAKGDRDIRRPTKVSELCAVAGVEEHRVLAVVNKFRETGRTFLTSPDAAGLTADSIVDVTHESLIRLWSTLHEWVAEEAESAHLYRRLAESAVEGRAAYHDQDLKQALSWWRETRPNQDWAARYHPAFRQAMEFLDSSWKLDRARNRKKIAALAGLFVSTVVAIGFAIMTSRQEVELAARELLAEAQQSPKMKGPALETSALLALESILQHPLFENQQVLRADLALLPPPIATLQNDASVQVLAFSPDGKRIATGTDDGSIHLFEVPTGKEMFRVHVLTQVFAIVFSPDGRTLAAGSFEGAALYEAATGKKVAALSDNAVYSIAFSPDGRRVVTGDGSGQARAFDPATGRELWVSIQGGIINAVAFSPDGRNVATGSGDGTARIFDAVTGRQTALFPHPGQVQTIAFSPDGRFLAAAGTATPDPQGPGIAQVFELKSGKETARILQHKIVNAVAFSPGGDKVVAGGDDGIARVFSAKSPNELSHFDHEDPVVGVAFSSDGRWVATASLDHTGRIFEAETGKEIARLIHKGKVRVVAFSPNGKIVATGSDDHTVRLFTVGDGNATARIPHNSHVTLATFSPNGKLVATATEDDTVRIVPADSGADSGKELPKAPGEGHIVAMTFSPDEKLLAVGVDDGSTMVYEVATGRKVASVEDVFPVTALAFSPDSSQVACGHGDGLLQVFQTRDSKEILRTTLGSRTLLPSDAISVIKFSPDGTRIMTGNESAVTGNFSGQVIEVATGREVLRHQHQAVVRAVAFDPQRNLALSASYDGTAALLDLATGQVIDHPIKDLGEVNTVAFSPDGELFAIGSSVRQPDGSTAGSVWVFDTGSLAQLVQRPQDRPVQNVIFSSDGQWVASASKDHLIQVFEALGGKDVAQIEADEIKDIRFTEDGALQVLSAEAMGPGEPNALSIEKHLLKTEDLIEQACSKLTRNLSADEWKASFRMQAPHKTCPQLP